MITTEPLADRGRMPQLQTLAKCCAYGLVLLLPGSFVILALLWLGRRLGVVSARPQALPISL